MTVTEGARPSTRRMPPPGRSLAELYPGLALQWDVEANGELTPRDVTAGSARKVHWVCAKDSRHLWEAAIGNRAALGAGCPVCAGKTVVAGVNDLATLRPDLAAEWDTAANGDIGSEHVTVGSPRKAHWVCAKDERHRWVASVESRACAAGNGCPVCGGYTVLAGFNDLATLRPDLAAEWDVEANGDLTPQDVTAGSGKKAHWVCVKDSRHLWVATPNGRTTSGTGCPACSGNAVLAGFNDLATLRPDLAAEWDMEANGDLTPRDATAASGKKAQWVCAKDSRHTWAATISNRAAHGAGCPVCSGRTVLTGFNDLSTTHPEIAAEWDVVANGDLRPDRVKSGSKTKVHWVCPDNLRHRWVASLNGRTSNGSGCPVCAGRTVLPGSNDLATLHPRLAAQWDVVANGDLRPEHVTAGSRKNAHWTCAMDPRHRWVAAIHSRVFSGRNCPVCAGRTVLPGFNDLSTTHPEIASEWDFEANGDLHPDHLTSGSHKKVHWVCATDSRHRWGATAKSRTSNGSGCPVCAGNAVVVGLNDLATLRPEIAAEWDAEANSDLRPEHVTAGSRKKVHWTCANDSRHRWEATVGDRTGRGNGCPVCAGRTVLPGFNDLASLRPDLADEWDAEPNGDVGPSIVTVGSDRKVHWVCATDSRHRWVTTIKDRTGKNPTGCPMCASTGPSAAETDLADTLATHAPNLPLIRSDRSTLPGRFELDMLFPSAAFAVEFNGVYWHSEATGTSRDYHATKSRAARAAGIDLIHVWEDDWRDRRVLVLRSILTKLGVLTQAAATEPELAPFTRNVTPAQCTVVPVPEPQAAAFLTANHLQGATTTGSTHLGLSDATGALVALLTASVSGSRATILRYATSCIVPGGFTRLEAALAAQLPPNVSALVMHADVAAGDPGPGEADGWTSTGGTKPDYSYVVGANRVRKSDYSQKRFRDDADLDHQAGLSVHDLADLNGLHRIWDAGTIRWVKPVSVILAAMPADPFTPDTLGLAA